MSNHTNTLLAAAGGGALAWLIADRVIGRREAEAKAPPPSQSPAPAPTPPTSRPRRPPPGRVDLTRLSPRTFDAVFAEYGHGLPVAYLRALARHESDMNPRAVTRGAVGLLQVIDVVRRDFNTKHGTSYVRRDLFDPAINVTIASGVLARIVAAYDRYHPEVPNLVADWSNPRFVELLTFGWNAGFSERAGVGLVASTLVARRQRDMTIDDIHRAAAAAGASRHLSNPRKVRFAKDVTATYFRERARDQTERYVGPLVATATAPPASPVAAPGDVDATGSA